MTTFIQERPGVELQAASPKVKPSKRRALQRSKCAVRVSQGSQTLPRTAAAPWSRSGPHQLSVRERRVAALKECRWQAMAPGLKRNSGSAMAPQHLLAYQPKYKMVSGSG